MISRMAFSLTTALLIPAFIKADIRSLSQHFDEPDGTISPWMFIPKDNVKKVSTTDHPGLAAIWIGDKEKDIKGVLEKPINSAEHRLPIQFQCSWIQNFDATTGRSEGQINYAMGANVTVTFSDASKWPKDREQLPPDAHSIQLFAVHLGNYGEVGKGLSQLIKKGYPSPETYLVYGRSDFDNPVKGNWEIPHIWIGDGARYAGPASNQIFFDVTIESETQISIGIKFDASHGWNKRRIDLSEFGKITGIWEIGPIISGDRWIPDILAKELDIKEPPKVSVPDNSFEYFLDYCVLRQTSPIPFEEHSDEFNIPGYLGKWQIQEQATIVESFSHPGYLTITLLGPGVGTCFGHAGVSNLSLENYPPPWEIEICMIPPDNKYPWNIFLNFGLYDGPYDDPHWLKLQGIKPKEQDSKLLGFWRPGIQNTRENGLEPMKTNMANGINVEFENPVPKSILGHKPVYMLIQVIDDSHIRLGYKARKDDSWYMSKVCDLKEKLGSKVFQYGPHHAWSICTSPKWGGEDGLPAYEKFLIDYIRYRYGLSIK